jgi:small conductance mechanosensitive channel
MLKRGVDITLQKFLGDFLKLDTESITFCDRVSQLGVPATSFVAI